MSMSLSLSRKLFIKNTHVTHEIDKQFKMQRGKKSQDKNTEICHKNICYNK